MVKFDDLVSPTSLLQPERVRETAAHRGVLNYFKVRKQVVWNRACQLSRDRATYIDSVYFQIDGEIKMNKKEL